MQEQQNRFVCIQLSRLHHPPHCFSRFIMPHRSQLRRNLPVGHFPLPRPKRHTLLHDPPQPLGHRPGPTPQAKLHVRTTQRHHLSLLPLGFPNQALISVPPAQPSPSLLPKHNPVRGQSRQLWRDRHNPGLDR